MTDRERKFPNFEWTPELIARGRQLWDGGYSTATIGNMLGCGKNAIVGKAHRLHWPARESPIARGYFGPRKPPKPKRARGPTLAPLPAKPVVAVPEPAEPAPLAVRPRPPVTPPCCWPLGEPRSPSFRFCGDPSLPGRSYCERHRIQSLDLAGMKRLGLRVPSADKSLLDQGVA